MKDLIDTFAEAYITVYGIEKWNSLTDQQKHDAIMFIARDLHERFNRSEA